MMECGPSKETQTRKWIIDLDGKVEDLHTFGLLPAGELCAEEVSWLHDTYPFANKGAFGRTSDNCINRPWLLEVPSAKH